LSVATEVLVKTEALLGADCEFSSSTSGDDAGAFMTECEIEFIVEVVVVMADEETIWW